MICPLVGYVVQISLATACSPLLVDRYSVGLSRLPKPLNQIYLAVNIETNNFLDSIKSKYYYNDGSSFHFLLFVFFFCYYFCLFPLTPTDLGSRKLVNFWGPRLTLPPPVFARHVIECYDFRNWPRMARNQWSSKQKRERLD